MYFSLWLIKPIRDQILLCHSLHKLHYSWVMDDMETMYLVYIFVIS